MIASELSIMERLGITINQTKAIIEEIESIGVDNITVNKVKKMSNTYLQLTKLDRFFDGERTDTQASDILFALKQLINHDNKRDM